MIASRTAIEQVGTPPAAGAPILAKTVLAALGDDFSEKIIASVAEQARTVEEVSELEGIPLSTCYRRIRELVESGLLLVERIIITRTGSRYALYRACFSSFKITFDSTGAHVQAQVNAEVAEKVHDRELRSTYPVQYGRVA